MLVTTGICHRSPLPGPLAPGTDLRAAGVQSFATGNDHLLVFAVSTWDRYSNAAYNNYQVSIDADQDGVVDWQVFTYDQGVVRFQSHNGVTETFLRQMSTGRLFASGYLANAPTDSSTILLPVRASSVGVSGVFDYTADAIGRGAQDVGNDMASYDPTRPVLDTTGLSRTIEPGGEVKVRAHVDVGAWKDLGTLGAMVVVRDNPAGERRTPYLTLRHLVTVVSAL